MAGVVKFQANSGPRFCNDESRSPFMNAVSIPSSLQLRRLEEAACENNRRNMLPNRDLNSWRSSTRSPALDPSPSPPSKTQSEDGNETKQTWGSDLELASSSCCPSASIIAAAQHPRTNSAQPSPSHQGTLVLLSPLSKRNGDALSSSCCGIDLNLDLEEPPSSDSSKNCAFLVSEPARQGDTFLNLQLRTAVKSQPLAISEEESCFSMECFALESPICGKNSFFYPLGNDSANAYVKQITPCASSDESIGNMSMGSSGVFRKIVNFSSSEVNCNSCAASYTTSNNSMHSAPRINLVGFAGDRLYEESPATSTDHSWREESSVTQNWQTLPANSEINPRPRVRVNSTSERITEITLNELSQYFHMPINQASKELKVGLTVLKKKCREFGIPRWPHRKMKSLDSLIHSIQDLAKDQGVKSTTSVMNAVRELEEQKKMMEEMPGTELAERTKRLRQACFKANYKKRKLTVSSSSSSLPINSKHSVNILDLNRTLITSANQIGFL